MLIDFVLLFSFLHIVLFFSLSGAVERSSQELFIIFLFYYADFSFRLGERRLLLRIDQRKPIPLV